MRYKENGNVLFLILIAVALFAALSYAITQSSRSGNGDISKEKAALIASQITQYGASIESAVLRMRMSNGCSDTDISFETALSAYDFTHTPPVADACKIFHPSGGGISFQTPIDWFDTSSSSYDPSEAAYVTWGNGEYNVQDIGTDAPDLVFSLWGLKKSVCNELNKKLGIIYSGDDPPAETVNANVDYQGTYPATAVNVIGSTATALVGHSSGCFSDPTGYVYYHVLIPR